ncbi:hypothetical protein [uncultured Stenotrophomonas sp.]|uniref:hypothetical protein n=1 Tax=uncultured Stenotrophomonas sp. TaxID=165438 RepID=UPI0025E93013|nr:hypothetical protein [uncultured Stenotrophomonas sp.]
MEPGIGGCVVWWDAWAAVGTVSAVFAAIFAPAIQRRMQRKRLNALFAASYINNAVSIGVYFSNLRKEFPLDEISVEAADAAWKLANLEAARSRFQYLSQKLEGDHACGFDASKWPGVDLDLLLGMAHMLEAVSDVLHCGRTLGTMENEDWKDAEDSVKNLLKNCRGWIENGQERLKGARIRPRLKRLSKKSWY